MPMIKSEPVKVCPWFGGSVDYLGHSLGHLSPDWCRIVSIEYHTARFRRKSGWNGETECETLHLRNLPYKNQVQSAHAHLRRLMEGNSVVAWVQIHYEEHRNDD